MPQVSKDPRWTRHFLGRSERTRTTWKFRFLLATLAIGVVWATSGWWTTAVARSLVCEASGAPSDAILIENFDSDYLLFERAETLRRGGLAPRVLVPVKADPDTLQPNMVALGTANLMANIARLGAIDVVPWQEVEPISLNAARDIQRFVQREHIRSVLVLSPYFRSERSALVYGATLGRAGITVRCEPVHGGPGRDRWTDSLHGVQNVAEQWLKLQYYRLYILPFRS
jgi:hypothetical protein